MATAPSKAANTVKETIFSWEGKDKAGKQVRGELRAGGEAIVSATLLRRESGCASPAAKVCCCGEPEG